MGSVSGIPSSRFAGNLRYYCEDDVNDAHDFDHEVPAVIKLNLLN